MLDSFSAATRRWFDATFTSATRIQNDGWAAIAQGEHSLLVAPTGSGKTLAAFLWAIDQTTKLDLEAPPGVRVLYISPLKALVYDVERNLRAPLVGIQRAGEHLGLTLRRSSVDMRTGDTPAADRRAQLRRPGDILVTTPESLFLLLGSKARANLALVHTVIVDEIHAIAPTKRGAHLALSLERLDALTETPPQRIGLSATVRPIEDVAKFLGGGHRTVAIVDAAEPPNVDVEVVVPVPNMDRVDPPASGRPPGGSILGQLAREERPPAEVPAGERGIWSAMYPQLLDLILAHRTTIIFVNSRGLCERLAQRINELAVDRTTAEVIEENENSDESASLPQNSAAPLVLAHHGSVSHEKRAEMEEALKRGALRGIVATSSLELGIDMGTVDTVVLIESPGSVARGLQRVGRSGHQVGARSIGRIFPKFKGDLLECALIGRRMQHGEIEAVRVMSSPLDVLAQQLIAMCCDTPHHIDDLHRVVRGAYAFRDLSRDALVAVLDMVSGRYPSDEFADLTPRLSWDRATDVIQARRGTPMLSRLNAGTIPDRGLYGVFLGDDGPRVGELDEEMVFETRLGDRIILGASTWAVEGIGRDRVIVSPAPGEPGRMPFWHGEGPGRPVELGRALGAFTRELGQQRSEDLLGYIQSAAPLDPNAAENLASYITEQRLHTGTLPTDRTLTVERFRDELGDWRVCILSPFGAPIHAPWAMALTNMLSMRAGFEVQVMYTDDGIVLRFADTEELPAIEHLFPDPDDVEDLITAQLADTALFASLFRENAARALLLPRRNPKRRNPLWAQRRKAESLLAAVKRYPSFAVVIETYRQALGDVFDMQGLKSVLSDIQTRAIQVHEVETPSASPFARSLVFAYVAAYIYDQDAPVAERKAQALTLDRSLLGELLGQAELRELIDEQALDELELELQALLVDRAPRDADELHDRLRRVGDMTLDELSERAPEGDVQTWLETLARARRAARINVAGEPRWIAAEDAALYRDALGCMPPSGLPDAFLVTIDRPLERLLSRYARTHGPFVTREPANRFGLRVAQVEPVLALMERDGTVVRGEIRPGGTQLEWCDAGVLKTLKRRTLAKLRNQVAAVDPSVFGEFLPQWHGIGETLSGPQRLIEVLTQLEGLALPWSALVNSILPLRIPGFRSDQLDLLSATGQIVWVGQGALGARDGRIAFFRRESVGVLLPVPNSGDTPGPIHASIMEHLADRGASFAFELDTVARAAVPDATATEIDSALWDLVWEGLITNDTFQPLQTLGRRRSPAATSRPTARGRRGQAAALTSGRWSLVASLCDLSVTDTERTLERARTLLDRYGVVSREAALAEEIPGGFSPLYRTLSMMEESGQVRRGYFIEALSGAQFSYGGAIERLRATRNDPSSVPMDNDSPATPVVLCAVDPANPYGTLLPWPASGATSHVGAAELAPTTAAYRPRRVSGAWVVLQAGKPVIYVGPGARQLLTFLAGVPPDDLGPVVGRALDAIAPFLSGAKRRTAVIEKIDGVSARESPLRTLFEANGFVADHRGLIKDRYARG